MQETHPKDGLPVLAFADAGAFRKWLAKHQGEVGLWLKLGRKGSGHASVTYAEALDIALCYGWIDGQTGKLDESWTLRRFTPRTKRSRWSQINCRHVERLAAAGLIEARGQSEINAAKADGRWEAAYAPAREITVPEDLKAALKANAAAGEFFAKLTSQNRFAVLFRIHDAKKPETRARRIEKFVSMLAEGKTMH